MIDLAYMMIMHGRHEVAVPALRHCAELRDALAAQCRMRLLVVMSPGDITAMVPLCESLDVWWIVAANNPVSVKHQAGLLAIRALWPKVDGVMYAGADDFVSAAYVAHAAKRLAASRLAAFGSDRVWFLDGATGRMVHWSLPMLLPGGRRVPVGAGRTLGREFLEDVDWQLWPFAKDKGLDTHSSIHLENRGRFMDVLDLGQLPGAYVIDVKTPGNIHSFSEFDSTACRLTPSQADAACRAVGIDREAWLQ